MVKLILSGIQDINTLKTKQGRDRYENVFDSAVVKQFLKVFRPIIVLPSVKNIS